MFHVSNGISLGNGPSPLHNMWQKLHMALGRQVGRASKCAVGLGGEGFLLCLFMAFFVRRGVSVCVCGWSCLSLIVKTCRIGADPDKVRIW